MLMELAQVDISCNTPLMETADAVFLDPQHPTVALSTITSFKVHQNQQLPAIPWKVSGLDVIATQTDKISTQMVQQIHRHVLTTSKD